MAYAWDDEDEALPPADVVRQELEDWRQRLSRLFDILEAWTGTHSAVRVTRSKVTRQEAMMTATGVGIMEFPAMGIGRAGPEAEGKRGITIRPEARWVVGTHGRVWIDTPEGRLYLIDKGDDARADWWIYPRREPYVSVPFTREEFELILQELP